MGVAGFYLALLGYLANMKRELKADIGRFDARLVTLENGTYDISARLPPAPASSSPPAS